MARALVFVALKQWKKSSHRDGFPFLEALPWEITEIRGLSLADLKSLLTFLRPAAEQSKKQNTTLRLVAFADLSGVNIPARPIKKPPDKGSGSRQSFGFATGGRWFGAWVGQWYFLEGCLVIRCSLTKHIGRT